MKKGLHIVLTSFYFFILTNVFTQLNKPNVVFIMCDDLNDYQGILGGHPQAKTPNIDKLASSGIRFTNAQTNVPVCQPSRNSLFTGVYPHNSKDFKWTPKEKQNTLKNNKTIMNLFKENGYYTLGTGKLMHGNSKDGWDKWGEPHAQNYGPFYFDGEKVMPNPSTPKPFNEIGPIDGSFGPLSAGGISNGKKNEKGWILGWNRKPLRYINDDDRDLLPDELHANWAEHQFKAMSKEQNTQPFFMGIGFVRPHTPLNAPDKYFNMFPIETLQLPKWIKDDINDTYYVENFGDNLKGSKYYKTILESYNGDREIAIKHFLQAYLACVAFVDEQVGKVVKAIESSKYRDNTVIIFTSDHGWQMGEKNYLFKNSPWEESARIPLIFKLPNQIVGNLVDQPVSLIDIFPTLIDLCNLKGDYRKNKEGGDMGGYSLKPLLYGNGKWQGPNGALTLVGNNGHSKSENEQTYSYRTHQFRLIRYGNGKKELYDHHNDPHEWQNIANNKKNKKLIQQLNNEMDNILINR